MTSKEKSIIPTPPLLEEQFGGLKIDIDELSMLMANRFKSTTKTNTATSSTIKKKKKKVNSKVITIDNNHQQINNSKTQPLQFASIKCFELDFESQYAESIDSDDEFDRPLTQEQLDHTNQLLMDYQMESNCQIDYNTNTNITNTNTHSIRVNNNEKEMGQSDSDEHYENYTPKYYSSELSDFQGVIESDPQQIVRYGKIPVLFERMIGKSGEQKCLKCNRECTFEMQLMPHVLKYIKDIKDLQGNGNDSDQKMENTNANITSSRSTFLSLSESLIDFATVLVYRCDCCLNRDEEDGVVYKEERVVMQRDTLF